MPLALVGIFLGYLLISAAIRNEHPLAQVITAFGGIAPPVPGRDPTTGLQSPGAEPAGVGIDPETGGVSGADYGPSIGGTPAVQAFWQAVQAKFGNKAKNLGVSACRRIKPHNGGTSNVWSEHAWSNAIDIGGVNARIGVWALRHKRKYRIVNAIPPGAAVNSWHFDFEPSHAGQTPPCASG